MPEPILEDMVAEMKRMEGALNRARDLIDFMSEVGEPVQEQKVKLRETEARVNKWKAGLRARGYDLG